MDNGNSCVTLVLLPAKISDEYIGSAGTPSIVIFGTKDPSVAPVFVHVTLTSNVQIPPVHGILLGVADIDVATIFAGACSPDPNDLDP